MQALNFKTWIVETNLTQAIQLYQYKPGDVIDSQDLKTRFRKLAMIHHPDRGGDETTMKQVYDGMELLSKLNQIPQTSNWRQWQPNPINDIKNELNKAIMAIKRKRPEDAYAIVSRLIDPNTGKLKAHSVKDSLQQWLNYYKQGFHDYLEPILVTALKLIN